MNSDMVRDEQLMARLPLRLADFVRHCAHERHVIVLPTTTLLEVQRHQNERRSQTLNEVRNALVLLRQHGISTAQVDPEQVIALPDLVALMRSFGGEIEVIEPTIEDFNEAHRRTCLRQPPHPVATKSDEMRDMVIWAIAVRVARERGATLLVSGDGVHHSDAGDSEADAVGLRRAKTLESALELLSLATPEGDLARRLLRAVWPELVAAGFPPLSDRSVVAVRDPSFAAGEDEHAPPRQASFHFAARTRDNQTIERVVELVAGDANQTSLIVFDAALDGEALPVAGPIVLPPTLLVKMGFAGETEGPSEVRKGVRE